VILTELETLGFAGRVFRQFSNEFYPARIFIVGQPSFIKYKKNDLLSKKLPSRVAFILFIYYINKKNTGSAENKFFNFKEVFQDAAKKN